GGPHRLPRRRGGEPALLGGAPRKRARARRALLPRAEDHRVSALHDLSLREAAARVRRREVSATELARDAFARIAAVDGRVGAFLTLDEAGALATARAVDRRVAAGEDPGPLCGVAGMKPTYGRVSRYGVIAYASSLDQVGPIAREVADVAVVLEAIAGHDPADSTASPRPVPSYAAALDGSVRGLRLGLPREYFVEGMQADVERGVRAAVAELERLGAAVEPVSLPHTEYAIATYYLIATAEASSNLARLPALALPCGFDGAGLPIGLQVIGRPFDEATVLRIGHAYEQATEWHHRSAPP